MTGSAAVSVFYADVLGKPSFKANDIDFIVPTAGEAHAQHLMYVFAEALKVCKHYIFQKKSNKALTAFWLDQPHRSEIRL